MNTTAKPKEQREIMRVFNTRSRTRAAYDAASPFYDLLMKWNEAPTLAAARGLLGAKRGERILEIGPGTGHSLVEFARSVGPSGRVFGTDLSAKMLKRATANLAKTDLLDRCELRPGEACELSYPDQSMDAVFMSFVLELFDTPEIPRVLGECRRVLVPGGRLVIAGMSKSGRRDLVLRFFEWTHRHFPRLLDCRPIYVRDAMETAGFQITGGLMKRRVIPVEIVSGIKPPGS